MQYDLLSVSVLRVADALFLALTFEAERRASSPHDVAACLDEIEAAYFAVPRARESEEPVARHIAAYHQLRAEATIPGVSNAVLAEIEAADRAVRRLELQLADPDVVDRLKAAVRLLAESETRRIYEGRLRTPTPSPVIPPLELVELTMAAPLEIVASIPPEYWTLGGVSVLLGTIEKRFNTVSRIRTERVGLSARRAERQADEREAQLREAQAAEALAELRNSERERTEEHALLSGIEADESFRLVHGEISASLPETPRRRSRRRAGGEALGSDVD